MIGGVAGGLAAYLNKESRTIRLIFAAPFILSVLFGILRGFTWDYDFNIFSNLVFGSISSTFALVYIILWMVLPEANSTYEKMEMRGEKVDVNSIRQNVREGMDNVKDRVKGWSEEVKESAQNFSNKARDFANSRSKTFASEINETASRGGRGLGHAIGVLFKVFFLFIAGTIAFSLFVAFIALLFGGIAWWPINNFLWTSKWQQLNGWGTLIFFFGVPLIGFITWLVRRILRVKSRNSYLGWTFGFLWTIGWICAVLLAVSVSKDFRNRESITVPVNISQPKQNKMIVVVSEPEIEYNGNFAWMNDNDDSPDGWDLTEDTLRLAAVDFSFYKSDDSMYHVNILKYSCGRNEGDAMNRAEKIQYSVSSMDSILDLGSGFAIHKSSKYRVQHVEVQIHIPVGKKIRFDRTVREKLHAMDIDWRSRRNWSRERKSSYYRNGYYLKSDTDYTMDANGELSDGSAKPAIKNEDGGYRYKDTVSHKQKENIEPKYLQKEPERAATAKQESMDDKEPATSGSSSSGLSLMAWF
jgi:phage shock protein PspC (stress-responsive transcriptional regulator)